MATANPDGARPAPGSVHVQLDREQLLQLEDLRGAIQRSLASSLVVSRADVVRLALRRLTLCHMAHVAFMDQLGPTDQQTWEAVIAAIHSEGTCPPWLMPGQGETPRPKKKGR